MILMEASYNKDSLDGVAIIGMAGRFPGAKNIHEFWENLKQGVESITYFDKEEARACGVDEQLLNDPNYVFASGILEDIELFDAGFFGFTPREAENMDPQQRLFLECCYEALEDGGYAKNSYDYPVGVYAGSNMSYYFLYHLLNKMGVKDDLAIAAGNDKDYLATRASYEFNLKGPSINIQTACSTSATAIAMAYEGLLNYHCDMAIAGGSGIKLPQKAGYLFQEGFIGSPDGHTRPFDDNAYGTVFTSVTGTVLMKRLEDAIRDGDHIYAVIKGMAVNNDGSDKVGFTAPSREGQAEVIAAAQNLAGVNPEDISYIETHGTGTTLGDPIEVSALTNVFKESTERKAFCAIGSVKGNIGHAISGSGVASIIKTALALENKQLPPTINFEVPNSKIDFENSPFYVNTELCEWESREKPRIAGISSFGFGGTNVHAVIEEAPKLEAYLDTRQWKLITVSAKTSTALDNICNNLAIHFRNNPEIGFADVVYTLNVGRKEFEHRRAIVCSSLEEAVKLLESGEGQNVIAGLAKSIELENTSGNELINSESVGEKETLISLAKLWVSGTPIDWESFYEDEKRLRIPLPTYPFDRKRHWIEQYNVKDLVSAVSKDSSASKDFNDWTYFPSWKRAISIEIDSKKLVEGESWMIFVDEMGLGNKIREFLEKKGIEIIEVARGNNFTKISSKQYLINAANKHDYSLLINDIVDSGTKLKKILHLWGVTGSHKNASRLEFSQQCQDYGFYSMMYLAQALGNKGLEDRLGIVAVTNNMHFISGEQELQPEKATIIGPCKVIPREYSEISCQSIDIVLPEMESVAGKKLVEVIIAEMTAKEPEFIVAVRGSSRWLQTYERFKIEAPEGTSLAKDGATYLITGGLGGLGTAIAQYMSKIAKANFILTRRSAFPERDKWTDWLTEHSKNDKTSLKIKQLMEIENSGSRVMVSNIDTSDLEQMRQLVEHAELVFGTINGVIHAAGIADNGLISDKKTEVAIKVLTPKVEGTLVLDEIFTNRSLDYTVLFSSSSAILGNAGFVDYCAANTFLDVYAQYKNNNSRNYTVAINWDEWDEVGMAADNNTKDRVRNKVSLQEGLILLDRIVSTKASAQVVVSSGDLVGMLWNIRNFMLASLEGRSLKEQNTQVENNRPDLQTQYIEPSNMAEEDIAEIWQNLLGICPVGVNDDFFDLGGDSLLATTLVSELAKKFHQTITLQNLFERSTVKQLAEMFQTEDDSEDEENYEEGQL